MRLTRRIGETRWSVDPFVGDSYIFDEYSTLGWTQPILRTVFDDRYTHMKPLYPRTPNECLIDETDKPQ